MSETLEKANLEKDSISNFIKKCKNTKAIIIDVRNYPNNIEYDIAEYLNPKPTEFVKFIDSDLSYP